MQLACPTSCRNTRLEAFDVNIQNENEVSYRISREGAMKSIIILKFKYMRRFVETDAKKFKNNKRKD
jgi:hypothetical protein